MSPPPVAPARPVPPSDSKAAEQSAVPERPPVAPARPPYRAPDSGTSEQSAVAGEPASGSQAWWKSAPEGYPPTPPKVAPAAPRGSSKSLWDDDDLAKKLIASRPTPAAEPEALEDEPERRWGVWIGGAAAALVVIVVVVLVIVFASRGSDTDAPVAGPPPSTNPTTSAMNCPASTTGGVIIGNGAGDTDSGAGAIMGFQHAFFVDRSGAKVRSFVAPDSDRVPPAESIQQAIDTDIPQGTRFCLRIEQLAPDRFTTELTSFRPDGGTTLYRQLVTTVNQGGKNLVWGIVAI
ncbi:hypothetical protein ACWDSJ_22610 [Nocardia sp. NPDC003482]